MPEKISIPKTSELLESIRTPEQLVEKFPEGIWGVQPKYDGSKCVLIPTEAGYIATTGSGNKMECIPDYLGALNATLGKLPFSKQPVLEAEIEPMPWTQDNKVKLNGNLYKASAGLPFDIKLSVFDSISQRDFFAQESNGEKFKDRARRLEELKPILKSCGLDTSPIQFLTSEQVAKLMKDGIHKGKQTHRVLVEFEGKELSVEGLVIRQLDSVYQGGKRNPNAIKLKPFISLDLLVVAAAKKDNGTAALGCIDTKNPSQPYYLYTGLPKHIQSAPEKMVGQIVEIEVLTTDDPKTGAGNPTYKNDRPDKTFSDELDRNVIKIIEGKLTKAGLTVTKTYDANQLTPDI